jgi:hypothetical protein
MALEMLVINLVINELIIIIIIIIITEISSRTFHIYFQNIFLDVSQISICVVSFPYMVKK